MGGRVHAARADPGIRRDGVPPRAGAATRTGLPRAPDGRPFRRDGGSRPAAIAVERSDVRRPARGDEGGRAAERRRTAGGDRRQRHLVGRCVEAARSLRREWAAADLPQRLRARCAATRTRTVLPARARPSPRSGGRGLRDRNAARLPAAVRPLRRGEARARARRRERAGTQSST